MAQSTAGISTVARYALLIGPTMSLVDSSVVNVAVPQIADSFSGALAQAQWVVSGYLLALGVGLALSAWAARRFGPRSTYQLSLVAFTVASVLCAFAPTLGLLIAARALQGLCGAALVPVALSILLGPQGIGGRRVPVSAVLVLFLAPAFGPTLGGLLVTGAGWRWIFLVNAPVGLIGILLIARARLPVSVPPDPATRLDVVGVLMLAGGCTGCLLGAAEGTSVGWLSVSAILPALMGAALLAGYVARSLRRTDAALDLRFLRHRNSVALLGFQVVCSAVAPATIFLLPVFMQEVQGFSALESGLALLPQGIVTGVATYVSQRFSDRLPLRLVIVTGFILFAVSSAGLVFIAQGTPLWISALVVCGRGLAIGFITTPLLAAMLSPLDHAELPDANVAFNIGQRLGGSFGVSVLGSIIVTTSVSASVDSFQRAGVAVLFVSIASAVGAGFLIPRRAYSPTGVSTS